MQNRRKRFHFNPTEKPRPTTSFSNKSTEGCLNDFKIFLFVVATVDKHYIGACHPKAPRRSSITSAQMSLVNSIFNPWVYCALSRPYRKAYIYVQRRVGRVCGIRQSRPADIMALNDLSSRLRTSSKLNRLYRTQFTFLCILLCLW